MSKIGSVFGGKIRTRVCGICIEDDKILLVEHDMDGLPFYAPPGGAVEFGEAMPDALVREFREETGLKIQPGDLLFVTEYIRPPLHATEIFFKIDKSEGKLIKGHDPEMPNNNFIRSVRFYSMNELKEIPDVQLHHILHNCNNPRDVLELSGYIKPPSDIIK